MRKIRAQVEWLFALKNRITRRNVGQDGDALIDLRLLDALDQT